MSEISIASVSDTASSWERSVQHCLDKLVIWNDVENASDLTAQQVSHLQLLGARLRWWVMRWGMREVEMSAPAGVDVQHHLIQSCLELISNSVHDLAISHGDRQIITAMEAPNFRGSSGIPYAYSLDQDMEFDTSKGDETSAHQERQGLDLPTKEAQENLQRISDQILQLEGLLPSDPAPNGAAVFNVALSTSPSKLRSLSFPKDVDSFTPSLAQIKATSQDHISNIQVTRRRSADELRNGFNIPKLRENEAGVSYFGEYNESLVFVHEKKDPCPWQATLKRLAWQLRLSENIKELRILPCLGYTLDGSLTQDYIHHVIYAIPGKHVISLRDMLRSRNFRRFQSSLSLTMRFKIAQSLARSILYLHVAEWLHRGIRSSNVLFCSDAGFSGTHRQLGLPYLAGFDYTRPPSYDESAKIPTEYRERELYRHPAVLREPTTAPHAALGDNDELFSKNHDIYGLGVILVELGVGKSAGRLWMQRPKDKCNGCSKFQGYLIAEFIPKVRSITGRTYADAALYCLQADVYLPQEPDWAGAVAFYRNVIEPLERCKNTAI
ncbi:hypothetical protein BGW36DRAFT_386341 [Talaromyces proteolyticus]|uniref:Protein kinase domain-containing protein n=1 Tax=Talaromyces proteolyticus TaxID=1131652 RepID=A0AAD4KI49_9EURO|nr:uncharacterized protein BGW36DRAFT_386341 [Talaromyces proteolyticus]KAH8691807.1 hypothetical protein BGW36DRAFT_386341 [Talaromyces proteolyticus]